MIASTFKENREAILFVAKLLGLFLVLEGVYDYLLSPYTAVDNWLIGLLISQTETVLTVLGYELLEPNLAYTHHVGIAETSGVVIGNPCDGLSLFILYTSFLIIFSGKAWFKGLALTIGIFFIHFLNLGRIVCLALIVKYYPSWLDFHHSYTFTLFIYSCIFAMWFARVKIYQKKKW